MKTASNLILTVIFSAFFLWQAWSTFSKYQAARTTLQVISSTGCCKTSGQLWKPVTDAFFEVFLMFLGSFDCQLWAIFHFGTLNA